MRNFIDSMEQICSQLDIGSYEVEKVRQHIHLKDSDILIVSGSLVEGIGTPSSDFDFCVIAESMDERFDCHTFPQNRNLRFYKSRSRVKASFDYLEDSLLGVDVEYRTYDEIAEMLDRHDTLFRFLSNRARKYSAFVNTGIDYRFLSRLENAIAIQNSSRYENLRSRLKDEEMRYTCFRTAVGSYPDFRDIVGCWVQGDYSTGLQITRKFVTDNYRGLTHLLGNKNRNHKYLLRYADKYIPEQYQNTVACFREMQIHDIGVCGSPRSAIVSWLDLLDEIFSVIRAERKSLGCFPTEEEFTELLLCEFNSSSKWHSELDNEYTFRAKEVTEDLPSSNTILTCSAGLDSDCVESHLRSRLVQSGRNPVGEQQNAFS